MIKFSKSGLQGLADGNMIESLGIPSHVAAQLAKELLTTRAELENEQARLRRLSGNAHVPNAITEAERTLFEEGIKVSYATEIANGMRRLIDFHDAALRELAAMRAVLLDRRLDDGYEQLRERCAQEVSDFVMELANTASEHDVIDAQLAIDAMNVVLSVPLDGQLAASAIREAAEEREQGRFKPAREPNATPLCRWCGQSEDNHRDRIGAAGDCTFEPKASTGGVEVGL